MTETPMGWKPISVFLWYALKDKAYAEELEKHLRPFTDFTLWHEGKLLPGIHRQKAIEECLGTVDLIVVLISADLLASDDLPRRMALVQERFYAGAVHIVPILIRPAAWEQSAFADMEPLPRNRKPVSSWASRDEAWTSIGQEVQSMAMALRSNKAGQRRAMPPSGAIAAQRTSPSEGSLGSGVQEPPLARDGEVLQLYEALNRLLPSQLDELIFRLGAPSQHLSPATVAHSTRAREIIALATQGGAGALNRLAELLEKSAPGIMTPARRESDTLVDASHAYASGRYGFSAPASDGRSADALAFRRSAAIAPVSAQIVILTALPLECKAVLRHLSDLHEEELRSGTLVDVGTFAASDGPIRVGVVEVGAGNIASAATAQEVFSYFEPAALIFVGVAGGLKDVAVGDVVAATRVYGFESGNAAADFMPRPDVAQSSHRLIQRARAVARNERWLARLGLEPGAGEAPSIHIGPIAAGSQVISSTRSFIHQFLLQQYSDALAVEMEGRGFLEAAWRNQIDALVVRGISDLIDQKAMSEAKGSQPLAARNAATFAFEVIANLSL